jgi:hypothetical protein
LRGQDVARGRPQQDVVESEAGLDFHVCHYTLR